MFESKLYKKYYPIKTISDKNKFFDENSIAIKARMKKIKFYYEYLLMQGYFDQDELNEFECIRGMVSYALIDPAMISIDDTNRFLRYDTGYHKIITSLLLTGIKLITVLVVLLAIFGVLPVLRIFYYSISK